MPVSTVELHGAVDTIFPDVTLCNLHPIPQTAQRYGNPEYNKYAPLLWQKFLDIHRNEKSLNSTNYFFQYRVIHSFLAHFWSSYRVHNIGHNISHMLVECVYRGQEYYPSNFKLVVSWPYWNCYTFMPRQRKVIGMGSYSGLKLVLYTDTRLPEEDSAWHKKYRKKRQLVGKPKIFYKHTRKTVKVAYNVHLVMMMIAVR